MAIRERYSIIIPVIQKCNFWIFAAISFALPLYKPFVPFLIALWCLTWILEFNFKNRFTSFKSNKVLFFGSILFYCFHLISLVYTDNPEQGLFDLQVKFALLIFPICCIGLNKLYTKHYNKILFAFITGNLLASFICIIVAVYHILVLPVRHVDNIPDNYMNFFYSSISIFHHTSYFSMYLIFSIVLCFYFLFEVMNTKTIKSYLIFSIVIFIVMIFFLSSRAAFFTEIIVFCFLSIFYFSRNKNKFLRLTFLLLLAFSIFFILTNPRTKMLINEYSYRLKISDSRNNTLMDESAMSRFDIWRASLPVIKDHFLIGVGPGDVTNELVLNYRKNNFSYALSQRLNAHNQFIETTIGLGLVGLCFLLYILFTPLICSYKKRHLLMFFFLVITITNYLFESMFNTQSGVIFFAFFFNFLSFVDRNIPTFSAE